MTLLKRYIFTIVLCVLVLALTGCGDAIPELTKEQHDEICEYAAKLLLSYDKNYKNTIMDEDKIAERQQEMIDEAELKKKVEEQKIANEAAKNEKEEKDNQSSSKGDSSQSDAQKVNADIDEFLGLDGIDIEYTDYRICDSYPDDTAENDWQGVCRASGNNKLVVFNFSITNNSGSDYNLDMASMNARFTFKVNGNLSKSAITTLLGNDFIMYRGNILAGETINNVIVIELAGSDAENINSVVMKMKAGGNLTEKTLF